MATAYNIRNKLFRSSLADRGSRVDPGTGGVIIVGPVDRAVATLTGAGARTLEPATGVGLGTEILCCSVTASVTVNTIAIDAGEFAKFLVTLDSAGVKEWSLITSSQT